MSEESRIGKTDVGQILLTKKDYHPQRIPRQYPQTVVHVLNKLPAETQEALTMTLRRITKGFTDGII